VIQKFTLNFINGSVEIHIRINRSTSKFFVTWIKSSKDKIGLATQALKLLREFDYSPLYAYQVIVPAKTFWLKKLSEKLIAGYSECNCKICQNLRQIETDNYVADFILNSGTILTYSVSKRCLA
jgi:hypothetical protein